MSPRGPPTYECIYEECKRLPFRSKGSCKKHLLNKHITRRELRCIRCNERFPTVPKAKRHCRKCSLDEMAYKEDKLELHFYTSEHSGGCFSTPHQLAKDLLPLCKIDGRKHSGVTQDALPGSHAASKFSDSSAGASCSAQLPGPRASSMQETAVENDRAETIDLGPMSCEAMAASYPTCASSEANSNSHWRGRLPQRVVSEAANYRNSYLHSNHVNAVRIENSAEGLDHVTQQSAPWDGPPEFTADHQQPSLFHESQVHPPYYYYPASSSGGSQFS